MCIKTPKTCDLSSGVTVNGNKVTFNLTTADPEWLDKLSVPFAYILPAGTPAKNVNIPPPGTGPYMWAEYTPNKQIKLVRNPNFKEWSKDAQPAGNPDIITQKFGLTVEAEVTQVQNNQADWMFDQPPADRLGELSSPKYASRVHVNPLTATYYFALNVNVPPFNNLKARQGLNFATDRAALVKIAGGPKLAVPTCQVLPPNFPGYVPYCPYTKNPGTGGSGKWTAPDMAKAQQLINASGTKGDGGEGQHRLDRHRQGARPLLRRAAEPARLQGDAAGPLGRHPVPLHPELEEQGADRVLRLVPGLPGGVGLPEHPARVRLDPPELELEPEHRAVLRQGDSGADGSRGAGRHHRPDGGEQDLGPGGQGGHRPGAVGGDVQPEVHRLPLRRASRAYVFSPQWYFLLDQASVQ